MIIQKPRIINPVSLHRGNCLKELHEKHRDLSTQMRMTRRFQLIQHVNTKNHHGQCSKCILMTILYGTIGIAISI